MCMFGGTPWGPSIPTSTNRVQPKNFKLQGVTSIVQNGGWRETEQHRIYFLMWSELWLLKISYKSGYFVWDSQQQPRELCSWWEGLGNRVRPLNWKRTWWEGVRNDRPWERITEMAPLSKDLLIITLNVYTGDPQHFWLTCSSCVGLKHARLSPSS